jgi:hypothetical protein
MEKKSLVWPVLIGAIVGSLYWFATMGKSTIMGINIFQLFGMGAFFAALFLRLRLRIDPLVIGLFIMLGAEMTIIAKIAYDIHLDRTSHSLLGLDIIGTSFVIFLAALAGAYLEKAITGLRKKL